MSVVKDVVKDTKLALGLDLDKGENCAIGAELHAIVNDKLDGLGCPTVAGSDAEADEGMSLSMEARGYTRVPFSAMAPIDQRIQSYLDRLLGEAASLPAKTLSLDRFGLARVLSLPPGKDEFVSDIVSSYRLKQGVLHNPKNDRRTTKGVFHVAEGGMPIPADKKSVPVKVFGALLKAALNPPAALMELPYTAAQPKKAAAWVSLYLRPIVSPEVANVVLEKTMETRFLAPGNLVGNLDFVESVFGNAGDPFTNDAAEDVEHWSGHTGFIMLAPHLINLTKKELGLPPIEQATPRQKADGMCYKDPTEKYNEGQAFKITSRDEDGVIVTIIADNYFGYCKKEVKTQLSYATNLFGLCEEEHAGGALTFAAYDLGEDFQLSEVVRGPAQDRSFAASMELLGETVELHPEGYAVDKHYNNIFYVPQATRFCLHDQLASWTDEKGVARKLKILPNMTYVLPSGYKVEMKKPADTRRWRLIGIVGEPCLCHKPATVSGGGKSEISKSIADACLNGSVFVMDFQADMEQVESLLGFDYSQIYKEPSRRLQKQLPVLSPDLSIGSVVRLFTHSDEYTDGYNDFLRAIPPHVIEIALVIKRLYKPDWEADWKKRFGVDVINGMPGHELKYKNERLIATFLRVGFERDGSWRTLGIRKDFYPAYKLQMEDDITASTVLPRDQIKGLGPADTKGSLKFVANCEYRLFQRPDDAIIRGYDKQTERDMTKPENFISNYQPLSKADVKGMVQDAIRFDRFSEPLQAFLREHAADPKGPAYAVSPSNPRIVDGAMSKNTRYLQNRPDLLNPRGKYLADVGIRLARGLKSTEPVYTPVNVIVPGRRNNPPEKGVPALCVFNPIHYMEMPELFMEWISSMTGKSPSTTGAGSEGALTKGPFNAIAPIIDLNAAYVSALLTDAPTFVTSAAYVGPFFKVDHDISLLIPEVFSRMLPHEREPAYLIKNGYLERCRDFPWKGGNVKASRLGWRMTAQFERTFFGRVFNSPGVVLTPEMLRPELQEKEIYVAGVQTIVETHQRAAQLYFDDNSIELAVPPLKALLTVMAKGEWNGLRSDDEEFRKLFTREAMLSSDWYAARLKAKQTAEVALWNKHLARLKAKQEADAAHKLKLEPKIAYCQAKLAECETPAYLKSLYGTLGLQDRMR